MEAGGAASFKFLHNGNDVNRGGECAPPFYFDRELTGVRDFDEREK